MILAALLAAGSFGGASAAPLYNVSVFDYQSWIDKARNALAVETFEQAPFNQKGDNDSFAFEDEVSGDPGGIAISGGTFDSSRFGELSAAGYRSAQVGLFTTFGMATGSGSTCASFDLLGNGCSNLALQYDPAVNGQGNTAPVFVDSGSPDAGGVFDQMGQWSLNSNDTNGIRWTASRSNGGSFNSLFFILRDAADAGRRPHGINSSINVNGSTQSAGFNDQRLGNDNRLLVQINFLEGVESADVTIATSRNDGFTIDGVGIAMSPVPLPAPALMLLAGLGGLAAIRRRRKTA